MISQWLGGQEGSRTGSPLREPPLRMALLAWASLSLLFLSGGTQAGIAFVLDKRGDDEKMASVAPLLAGVLCGLLFGYFAYLLRPTGEQG